jgi:hypothetical protein
MIHITSNWFCCGVVLQHGRVVRVAPIVSYMKLWSRQLVLDYCASRGWKVEEL